MKNERITVDLRDCIAAWEHDRDFAEDVLAARCEALAKASR